MTESGADGDDPGERTGSRSTALGLAAVASLCCLGPAAVAGGAAVTGGATSGALVAGGVVQTLTGALVTALVTAVPLAIAGLLLRWRMSRS